MLQRANDEGYRAFQGRQTYTARACGWLDAPSASVGFVPPKDFPSCLFVS